MLSVTSVFAALLSILFLTLSARVIVYRRSNLISLGDHGDKTLETRIRAHANCAEYAPMGLILLGLVELAGAPTVAVVVLGLMLLSGRLIHAIGFWGARPVLGLRTVGMVLTLLMLAVSAIGLLLHAVF